MDKAASARKTRYAHLTHRHPNPPSQPPTRDGASRSEGGSSRRPFLTTPRSPRLHNPDQFRRGERYPSIRRASLKTGLQQSPYRRAWHFSGKEARSVDGPQSADWGTGEDQGPQEGHLPRRQGRIFSSWARSRGSRHILSIAFASHSHISAMRTHCSGSADDKASWRHLAAASRQMLVESTTRLRPASRCNPTAGRPAGPLHGIGF